MPWLYLCNKIAYQDLNFSDLVSKTLHIRTSAEFNGVNPAHAEFDFILIESFRLPVVQTRGGRQAPHGAGSGRESLVPSGRKASGSFPFSRPLPS